MYLSYERSMSVMVSLIWRRESDLAKLLYLVSQFINPRLSKVSNL